MGLTHAHPKKICIWTTLAARRHCYLRSQLQNRSDSLDSVSALGSGECKPCMFTTLTCSCTKITPNFTYPSNATHLHPTQTYNCEPRSVKLVLCRHSSYSLNKSISLVVSSLARHTVDQVHEKMHLNVNLFFHFCRTMISFMCIISQKLQH